MERIAVLPRRRLNFYATLPRNVVGFLLGLVMAASGVIFSCGGCTVAASNDVVNVPLSRWLSLFGALYMFVHLLLIIMGVMMLSHSERIAALKTTKEGEIYDIHLLDVLFLIIAIPILIFLACFFVIGNYWFFSIDVYSKFVGSHALQCRQSLVSGYIWIIAIWISIPACSLYIVCRKALDAEDQERKNNASTQNKRPNKKRREQTEEKDSLLDISA